MDMLKDLEGEEPLSFLKELNESHMFPSVSHLAGYDMRDIADAIFLYFIILYIMQNEFELAPIARKYAARTLMSGEFTHFQTGTTDLRVMLTVFFDGGTMRHAIGNPQASEILAARTFLHLDEVRRFLKTIQNPIATGNWPKRFLFGLEKELCIDESNYRSIRRLAVDWPELKKHEKKLVVTRLLQAFRHRWKRSELLPYLEELAKEENLEIKGAANPETGETAKSGKFGFLKSLALTGAATLAGLAVGLKGKK